jgi:hypothetical protein
LDPIFTPIFVTALSAAGVGAATAAFIAPVLTGIVVAAGSYLLNAAMAPKPPKPEDGRQSFQSTTPHRIYGYGRGRVAGAKMCNEEKDGDLFYVAALVSHRIAAFVDFYLNDDLVEFTTDGVSVAEGEDDRYGSRRIKIYRRLGLTPETPYEALVAEIPEIWGANHRGDGTASLAMTCRTVSLEQQSSAYPYGLPQPSAVMEMALVWDFRNPAQNPDDESTWTFSTNPALCIAHHECFSEFGAQRDYRVALLPVINQWKIEANICDEMIARVSGTPEKRYELGGWTTTETDPKGIRAAMLATCDGWFCERGDGSIILTVGKFREPEVIITDDDIAGFYIQRDEAAEEKTNELSISFTSPSHAYSTVQCDPFIDSDDQLARGKKLITSFDLTWVQSFTRARRLGKREWHRIQQKSKGKLELRLSGINALYTRWIRVQSNTIPRLSNAIIENRSGKLMLAQAGCDLEFILVTAAVDDWVPATDEGLPPPDVTTPDLDSTLPVPTGFTAASFIRTVNSQPLKYVKVAADAALRADQSIFFEASLDAGTTYVEIKHERSTKTAEYGPLEDDEEYLFRARTMTSAERKSDPTTAVSIAGSALPLSLTPVSFSAAGSPTVSLSVRAANDAGTKALQFRRGTTAQTFAAATVISDQLANANDVRAATDTPGAGTWRYWATSKNASGALATAPAAFIDVVV